MRMFRLSLLVIFAFVANAASIPALRIVGGSDADIKEAPYQVAMLFLDTGIFNYRCGGAIITVKAVLSAAQCVERSSASSWRIRAGSSRHNSGGQVVQVASFRYHEDYDSLSRDNDIAIIFLSSELHFDLTVNAIILPQQGLEFNDGVDSFVTGWGHTMVGESISDVLQKMTVQTINQDVCKEAYNGRHPFTTNMVCAGRYGVGGLDICHEDTGSPMLTQGILYGIVSWGTESGCGSPWTPGVYTRVPMFRKWIDGNL